MKKHLDPSTWFWGSLLGLLLLAGLRFEILQQDSAALPVSADEEESTLVGIEAVEEPSTPAFQKQPAPNLFVGPLLKKPHAPTAHLRVATDTLGRDDSIYLSLKRHRVSEVQIAQLNQALRRIFDARSESRTSDYYTLTTDTSGAILRFEYTPHRTPERPVLVESRNGQLVGHRLQKPLETRIDGIEVRIEDNLSNAMSNAGEGEHLTDVLADDIFGSVVDFQRDPRRGDRISLLFEKQYIGDTFVRYGRVLLARYEGQQVSQLAVYFADSKGVGQYYDTEGNSLGRLFMLYPLSYRRISSRFNLKRFHPILKKSMPHLGTDYAAAQGTDVWATARGKVVHAGRKGGYGLMVEVEHPNGYRTRYAHLSRIRVRRGQYVPQKAHIGDVGATGRATGPHLHYELLKGGRHIDPETVNKSTRGEQLERRHMSAFKARRDELLAELERITAPVLAARPGD